MLGICLASIALIGTWAGVQGFLPTWADELVQGANWSAKGCTQVAMACGRSSAASSPPWWRPRIGRRPAYFGICLLSLTACQFLFRGIDQYNMKFLLAGGLAGCFTASFYGWLPLYLPELFPTRVPHDRPRTLLQLRPDYCE